MKPLRVEILRYTECIQETQNLAKHVNPPSTKGDILESTSWKVSEKELSVHDIRVAIKDGKALFMQDEL